MRQFTARRSTNGARNDNSRIWKWEKRDSKLILVSLRQKRCNISSEPKWDNFRLVNKLIIIYVRHKKINMHSILMCSVLIFPPQIAQCEVIIVKFFNKDFPRKRLSSVAWRWKVFSARNRSSFNIFIYSFPLMLRGFIYLVK